jgi:hypothetical protein
MPNVRIPVGAWRHVENSSDLDRLDDQETVESLREKLIYGLGQKTIDADLTRPEAKLLRELLEQVESEFSGEQAARSGQDPGETTGADYERVNELEDMLDPVQDAISSLNEALLSPWEMIMVINGRAFRLRTAPAPWSYSETEWQATACELELASLLHPSGPTVIDELEGSTGRHLSGEGALRELAASVTARTIADECGED